jgi:hypothetical protein
MKQMNRMKTPIKSLAFAFLATLSITAFGQDNETTTAPNNEIQTVFKTSGKASGGYGALTNKFTRIGGDFANLAGVYGGWYVNHKFLLGISAAAATNNIPVPDQYSIDPLRNMSYEYGQVGLITEYVLGSNKPVHLAFNLFSGAGFTVQYERHDWEHNDFDHHHDNHDDNWFFVAEPGVQLEVNLFKWMRFSPGVSYRAAFGSDAAGLSDSDLSNISYNATLKFGKF